jgi:phosphoglycerol transferase MdoB-like AlkP superfamily enzyme
VLGLAALLVVVPGGGTGASVATQVLSLGFLVALAYFATLMYRQHRTELYSLGDRRRAVIYVAAGVVLLTLTATSRLWRTGGGTIVWFVLVAAAVYAVVAIVLAARRY